MHLEINTAEGIERSPALEAHIRQKLQPVERRFGEKLTRIEVFLKDINATKGGIDKSCTIEARVQALDPIAVEAREEDMYKAVKAACSKLEKAVGHRLGRQESKH